MHSESVIPIAKGVDHEAKGVARGIMVDLSPSFHFWQLVCIKLCSLATVSVDIVKYARENTETFRLPFIFGNRCYAYSA